MYMPQKYKTQFPSKLTKNSYKQRINQSTNGVQQFLHFAVKDGLKFLVEIHHR